MNTASTPSQLGRHVQSRTNPSPPVFRTRALVGARSLGFVAGASVVLMAGLVGCEEQTVSSTQSTASTSHNASDSEQSGPLSETLNARYEQYQQQADDETKRIYKAGIEAVAQSGVLERAKNQGDNAPAFTLPDADGKDVSLASLLAEGPIVLVWYRGGWCPYCNLTLRAFAEKVPEIAEAGGRLVAISPELPDNTAATVSKNGIDYTVLSDVGNKVAQEFGVVFSLTPEVHAKYNAAFNFDSHNGQDSGQLPLAATYVIDREGVIRYAFLDADYTKRAEPSEVVEALKALP